jgi:hypothetical protein
MAQLAATALPMSIPGALGVPMTTRRASRARTVQMRRSFEGQLSQ